jgi:hypothetical protein
MYYESKVKLSPEGSIQGWTVTRLQGKGGAGGASATDTVDEDDGVDSEHFVDLHGGCSCQHMISRGITCRHILHVSTVIQFEQDGKPAVLGGAIDAYWLPKATECSNIAASTDIGLHAAAMTSSNVLDDLDVNNWSQMTPEQRRKEFLIMLAPLMDDVSRSQSVFNKVLATFPKFVEHCGSRVGTGVLNPPKATNKPGRKPTKRIRGQHDFIQGKKNS